MDIIAVGGIALSAVSTTFTAMAFFQARSQKAADQRQLSSLRVGAEEALRLATELQALADRDAAKLEHFGASARGAEVTATTAPAATDDGLSFRSTREALRQVFPGMVEEADSSAWRASVARNLTAGVQAQLESLSPSVSGRSRYRLVGLLTSGALVVATVMYILLR